MQAAALDCWKLSSSSARATDPSVYRNPANGIFILNYSEKINRLIAFSAIIGYPTVEEPVDLIN